MRKVDLSQLGPIKSGHLIEPCKIFEAKVVVEIDEDTNRLSEESLNYLREDASMTYDFALQFPINSVIDPEFHKDRFRAGASVLFKGKEMKDYLIDQFAIDFDDDSPEMEEFINGLGSFDDVMISIPQDVGYSQCVGYESSYIDSVSQDDEFLTIGFDSTSRPGAIGHDMKGARGPMRVQDSIACYCNSFPDEEGLDGILFLKESCAGDDEAGIQADLEEHAEILDEMVYQKLGVAGWKINGELFTECEDLPDCICQEEVGLFLPYEVSEVTPKLGSREGVIYIQIPLSEIARLPECSEI